MTPPLTDLRNTSLADWCFPLAVAAGCTLPGLIGFAAAVNPAHAASVRGCSDPIPDSGHGPI